MGDSRVEKETARHVLPMELQSIQLHTANHALSEYESTLINFIPVVEQLLGIFGEEGTEILKKEFGESYPFKMKKYKILRVLLNICHTYKTGLDKKIISTEDMTSQRFRRYLKASARLPMCETVMYDIYHSLLKHTDIKDMRIRNTQFILVMPKEKKIEEGLKKRKEAPENIGEENE